MIKEETVITKTCDKCKKTVTNFEIRFRVSFPVKSWDGSYCASDDRTVELCENCTKELKKFLDGE